MAYPTPTGGFPMCRLCAWAAKLEWLECRKWDGFGRAYLSPRWLWLTMGILTYLLPSPFHFLIMRDIVTLTHSECLSMGTEWLPFITASTTAICECDEAVVGQGSWLQNATRRSGTPTRWPNTVYAFPVKRGSKLFWVASPYSISMFRGKIVSHRLKLILLPRISRLCLLSLLLPGKAFVKC